MNPSTSETPKSVSRTALLPEITKSNDNQDDSDLSSLGFDNPDGPNYKGPYTEQQLGQSYHITQEYSSYQLEPQAPQVYPLATGVWPIHHTYNENPHHENAYNYLGRNSGSQNTLPTPTPLDEHFRSVNLRADGPLHRSQPGFSPYPTYSNQSQGRDQSESLVGPEAPSPAASSGDEKSTSISTPSSRSKQRNSFTCDNEDCTASFSRLADLQRHQSIVHTKEKLFPCSVNNCSRVKDRGFSRRDHLTEHLRSYHAIPIPKRKPGQRAAPSSGMMG
ncbi:uncharacterized protein K441DRAFT_658255 [Cenococcum geophilum 1.58]|uniref:uncharacterized protein n=1 Tax=Cenococcum geophilum 1.58 TaxID=794803 RepID=UPI00358F7D4A|nr:hypothetical protein K441DRAFT_658255 [Cenococcum geophilum 1.58]